MIKNPKELRQELLDDLRAFAEKYRPAVESGELPEFAPIIRAIDAGEPLDEIMETIERQQVRN